MRLKNTKKWTQYWKNREGMAQGYASKEAVMHPHRSMIVDAFREMGKPRSVLELGCATAPNLVRLKSVWPDIEVGGIDLNEQAIEIASQVCPGKFQTGNIKDLFFTTNCTDAVLTDAALIYLEPKLIEGVVREMGRIAAKYVVMCEFDSQSFLMRQALRWGGGYFAYDWSKLLSSLDFYDITIRKIPRHVWPGEPWQTFGAVVTARVPKI